MSEARPLTKELCISCGEYFGDADVEYCPKSEVKCGHHSNEIWRDARCKWCGFDGSPIKVRQ